MRRPLALAALVALCAVPLAGAPSASAAVGARSSPPTAQIQGSGSTWAENAINQWITDVQSSGLQVVYTGSGSAQGRSDFRNQVTDFGVSDIGFQGVDASTGNNDTNCQKFNPLGDCRPYAYLPIVAGGTSFPYQIRVGGQLYTGLRLSGQTLAKIFTNQITNWDNSEITADNNGFPALAGHHLPNLPIIPVIDSQGSGASAQFTAYLAKQYASIWRPFYGQDAETEYFPQGHGKTTAEPGSDGIINFITSAAGNGAIGYDEYSYAKQQQVNGGAGWPVALLENAAGYFTAPTLYNVAVALTKAQINMDKNSANYLLQNLDQVYTNNDQRAYAMSSYSYMIIPTSGSDQQIGTQAAPKAQALADYIDWAVCGGQAEVGPIGYSPLPINLAQASFDQMYKLHTADSAVQVSQLSIAKDCHNPTFWAGHSPSANYLAQIAPPIASCDKVGQGPCQGSSGVGSTGNPQHGKAPPPTNSPSSGSSTSPSSGSSTSPAGGTPSPGASSASVPGAATSTGTGSYSGTGGNGSTGGGGTLADTPTSLAESDNSNIGVVLGVLAAVEVLLLLAIPPIVARRRLQQDAARPPRGGAA